MIERYSRPEMAGVWSEDHRLRKLLEVEFVYLKVLAEEKQIPSSELEVLERCIHKLSVREVQKLEAQSRHEVLGILEALSQKIQSQAPTLSRYLHYGLTSNDLLDTTLSLQLLQAADILLEGWKEVSAAVVGLAKQHQFTWMVGRTHGIHAEPITFGAKLAGWHAEILRNIERLKSVREVIRYGKFSGAVGTFTQVGPHLEARVCEQLGLLPEPVATQVIPRDRHAEYFNALVLSAGAIERFATEIRHLQKTEVLEVEEPFGEKQKGSSAMPHKRNPVLCENLCGLARMLRSFQAGTMENMVLWHERDISHSSVERVFFPDATILLDFMLHRFLMVLKGLKVHKDRMGKNLNALRGLVFSQKVLLALVDKGLARFKAYELVQKHAMRAWQKDQDFMPQILKDPVVRKVLGVQGVKACFDLKQMQPPIREILKRGGIL
ncbi:MAG: adenylosuccinate lyase [Elusimicrobia bacterium]|nr:adenylosuccinate lyase [Elusimicrobiota bacterium]